MFSKTVAQVVEASSMSAVMDKASQKVDWIVHDLIEDERTRGQQWIVTGEPKMGKSRLAMQLAVSLAEGREFIGFKVPKRRKVLYFNFELAERVAASRVVEYFSENSERIRSCEGFLNVVSEFVSIEVLDEQWHQYIKDIVSVLDPDIIFWDVLRRMTGAEENNNVEMSRVMQKIRSISCNRTHVVVHHSRKELFDRNAGARGIRGASAIHAEVDGVISIAKVGRGHTLEFSTRSVAKLDSICLSSSGIDFVREERSVVGANKGREQKISAAKIFTPGVWMPRKDILIKFQKEYEKSQLSADRFILGELGAGRLVKRKAGREVQYKLNVE
ncbi:AAA family ATPase [Pseudomonas iridis]|uniref:AAA family ATPase n=1 Tax=Pseudomonas iridis TaxID=2710587 RepID=A0ABW8DPP3_9PSED